MTSCLVFHPAVQYEPGTVYSILAARTLRRLRIQKF
jgi:hypothetical protein